MNRLRQLYIVNEYWLKFLIITRSIQIFCVAISHMTWGSPKMAHAGILLVNFQHHIIIPRTQKLAFSWIKLTTKCINCTWSNNPTYPVNDIFLQLCNFIVKSIISKYLKSKDTFFAKYLCIIVALPVAPPFWNVLISFWKYS